MGLNYNSDAKLSPDNQKLAFNSSKNNTQQLTVLDIAQHKLARLCDDGYETWYSDASWSPDGRYVVEEIHDASYQSYDLLVDTQEMRAYLLHSGDYQHIIAWLAEPVPAP
jgi:Tol biopolymer transport system component